MILIFDVGGTTVKYGWWQENSLVEKGAFDTPTSWEDMMQQLKHVFLTKKGVSGVAFSLPGSVDSEKGMIKGISAIPYIHHFNIKKQLELLFDTPVAIENDANCAALAEIHYGIGKDSNDSAFFIIGSGIGGAVCMNRELVKGNNLFGGEFGYLLIDKNHTLSELASPVQVAQRYAQDQGFTHVFTGKDLFALADKGVSSANEAVDGIYDALSIAMYNICLTYNPEQIVIGGGISERENILAPIYQRLIQLLQTNGASEIEVKLDLCQYRQDANLIGAVANFMKREGKEIVF